MEINSQEIKKSQYNLYFDKSASINLSLKELDDELLLVVTNNVCLDINIIDMCMDASLVFFVNNSSTVNVHFVNDFGNKNITIKANVNDFASFNFYLADLSKANLNIESNVILLGEKAKGSFRFCSVADKGTLKKYNIGFDQIGVGTDTLFEGYGVSLKDGEIDAKGITHIEQNCTKATADQRVKIILFDKESKGKASPILKIDCDDIIANHSCAIGSLNEDHIFYLKTRGLDEEEARKLVTMGYLIPIQSFFDDSNKEKINSYIKEIF